MNVKFKWSNHVSKKTLIIEETGSKIIDEIYLFKFYIFLNLYNSLINKIVYINLYKFFKNVKKNIFWHIFHLKNCKKKD